MRDTQIERMTQDLCDIECKGMKCAVCDSYGCEYRMQAEALYNAGYRKASDVAREIFEEIEDISSDFPIYGNINTVILSERDLAFIKKKYTENKGE